MNNLRIPSPQEIGAPFGTWRESQIEIMERCAASPKRFLIIDAPTGVGKSGVAIALHYLFNSAKTVVTTSTKYLQTQYFDIFDVPTIWGRGNYECNAVPGLTAEEGPCEMNRGCDGSGKWSVCSYYRAKANAMRSPLAVLNTSYFLHEANFAGAFSGANLLIFDEGHLLESALMNFIGVQVAFSSIVKYAPDSKWRNLETPQQLKSLVSTFINRVHQDVLDTAKHVGEKDLYNVDALKKLKRVTGLYNRLRRILELDTRDWVLNRELSAYRLVPVVLGDMAHTYAFSHGERIVIMSATIGNGEIFARQLGIDTEDMEFISVPSPFTPAMRPVIVSPVAKLSHKSPQSEYDKLFAVINGIMAKHAGQNGIIHCVSFKLRDKILAGLTEENRARIITHGQGYFTREEAIARLKSSSDGTVLLSPSAEVGLDLPDDEGRWTIWAKVPFADLQDKQVNLRKERDPEWYLWNTVCTLIQGCGRIVRHQNDWGVSYILDRNFIWIVKSHPNLFPRWWLDALMFKRRDEIV